MKKWEGRETFSARCTNSFLCKRWWEKCTACNMWISCNSKLTKHNLFLIKWAIDGFISNCDNKISSYYVVLSLIRCDYWVSYLIIEQYNACHIHKFHFLNRSVLLFYSRNLIFDLIYNYILIHDSKIVWSLNPNLHDEEFEVRMWMHVRSNAFCLILHLIRYNNNWDNKKY